MAQWPPLNTPQSPGASQNLDSTWSTKRGCQGPPVLPTGWCHPSHFKPIIGMAKEEFP